MNYACGIQNLVETLTLLIICNGVSEWDLNGRLFNCLEKILYVDFNQSAYIWLKNF